MKHVEKVQIRKHIQIWPHTDYTQRVMVCDDPKWARAHVKESNARLQRLSKQPPRVNRDNPYREYYYMQQVKVAPGRK